MDAPASKPREDSPASGPSPEVQVPGKLSYIEQHPPRFSESAPVRVTFFEPIPADDEQPEAAA